MHLFRVSHCVDRDLGHDNERAWLHSACREARQSCEWNLLATKPPSGLLTLNVGRARKLAYGEWPIADTCADYHTSQYGGPKDLPDRAGTKLIPTALARSGHVYTQIHPNTAGNCQRLARSGHVHIQIHPNTAGNYQRLARSGHVHIQMHPNTVGSPYQDTYKPRCIQIRRVT